VCGQAAWDVDTLKNLFTISLKGASLRFFATFCLALHPLIEIVNGF